MAKNYSADEYAKRLGISPATMTKYCRDELVPCERVGKFQYVINIDDSESYELSKLKNYNPAKDPFPSGYISLHKLAKQLGSNTITLQHLISKYELPYMEPICRQILVPIGMIHRYEAAVNHIKPVQPVEQLPMNLDDAAHKEIARLHEELKVVRGELGVLRFEVSEIKNQFRSGLYSENSEENWHHNDLRMEGD